ncbi:unnamed protein product [Brassica oleracea]|uniref:(rape) hypothetical protein n=1 Tax=Brassica napus TaxID=3708 RepID=A0A816LZH5_BRANA|nr:unnamed protein product [Brassica napus]
MISRNREPNSMRRFSKSKRQGFGEFMTPTPVKRDRRWTRAQRDLLQQSPRVGMSVLRRRNFLQDFFP